MTSAKSNSMVAVLKPNSLARFAWFRTLAERMSALLGTQPVFRQSPPMLYFSISATFAFTAAAM